MCKSKIINNPEDPSTACPEENVGPIKFAESSGTDGSRLAELTRLEQPQLIHPRICKIAEHSACHPISFDGKGEARQGKLSFWV